MSLSRLKEILNNEFIHFFNTDMSVSENELRKYHNTVKTVDDLMRVISELGQWRAGLHVGRMGDIIQEVNKFDDLSEAIDYLTMKHNKLFNEYPSGTIYYQNTCIIAQSLLDVLAKLELEPGLNKDLQRELVDYRENLRQPEHDFNFSFGTLTSQGLIPASPFWQKQINATDTATKPVENTELKFK